jgi:hypothetical protein
VSRNIGNDVDSFAPASFKVQAALVEGDAQAHLHPSGDVLASIESGFEATIVYTPEAKRFSWHKVIRPEYSCFSSYAASGDEGDGGPSGTGGGNGDVGQQGGPGDPGQEGKRGGDAGRITAYVTVVATAFYPKLFAVVANNTFYLAPAGTELWFVATGGPGGAGGSGGDGGAGGEQAYESKQTVDEDGNEVSKNFGTGAAGDGGDGGDAAPGGDGGNGGSIDVTYDSKFPELREYIKTDVRPGAGGAAGAAGNGGPGGTTQAEVNPSEGNPGNPGKASDGGGDGREGRASVHGGNVSSRFNMRGLAIFGSPGAETITTKGDQAPMIDADGAAPTMHRRPPPPARPVEPPAPPKPRKHHKRGGR